MAIQANSTARRTHPLLLHSRGRRPCRGFPHAESTLIARSQAPSQEGLRRFIRRHAEILADVLRLAVALLQQVIHFNALKLWRLQFRPYWVNCDESCGWGRYPDPGQTVWRGRFVISGSWAKHPTD